MVGGSLRDAALGRPAHDWDLASDARPERLLEVFSGAVYENRFGTVGVRRDGEVFEITTFRSDHDYADFRRKVDEEIGRINGAFGTVSWSPIQYMYRSLSQRHLVALYRAAEVMLITPLRDG